MHFFEFCAISTGRSSSYEPIAHNSENCRLSDLRVCRRVGPALKARVQNSKKCLPTRERAASADGASRGNRLSSAHARGPPADKSAPPGNRECARATKAGGQAAPECSGPPYQRRAPPLRTARRARRAALRQGSPSRPAPPRSRRAAPRCRRPRDGSDSRWSRS